jgi:hypothetical protein
VSVDKIIQFLANECKWSSQKWLFWRHVSNTWEESVVTIYRKGEQCRGYLASFSTQTGFASGFILIFLRFEYRWRRHSPRWFLAKIECLKSTCFGFQPPEALLQHGMENTFQIFPKGFSWFSCPAQLHSIVICRITDSIHLWHGFFSLYHENYYMSIELFYIFGM